ncbi:N-acetylglucosamine kinase 1 [Exophiala xenobiotica]|uniref:Phosphotransferase n=1 Tax=Lithohypha guttulata TaxID=1690604 RepID=A0ABR0KBA6_9EURO|nr:N-acetylglucosamine kinase 1 [Lithohypha guttulata]KAK5318878.1 N-acetylglucosamine kinase 1 [Exophiala xenobiotica]
MTMVPLEIFQTILRHLDRLLVYLKIRPIGLRLPKSASRIFETRNHDVVLPTSIMRPLHEFQREALALFSEPCNIQRMSHMSACLNTEYVKKLKRGTECMLPSFCHTLPTGQEEGTFIALDMGGSTFRVALVALSTRVADNDGMNIKHITVNKINESIRRLPARQFFAWMAGKIQDMLHQCKDGQISQDETISIGLAWSFPIEQTSHQGGTVQPMGKGFKAHEGVIGQDLGNLLEVACRERGLEVQVNAIVNDSSATLLSQAYKDPATTMSLILGTGTNAAIYLPVKHLGEDKFGMRDPSWFEQAEKVIINTEVSMFGKGILPTTRWDEELNRAHSAPDFQPLEYMTTGRYLGELLRLVIAEAVGTCQMFGGLMPDNISGRYTLDTALLAAIEEDTTMGCISSAERIQKEFGLLSLPTPAEMTFLRTVVEAISHRAAAYIATAIHALWSLKHGGPHEATSKTSVAANGSVMLMYPGFRTRCQRYVADMIAAAHSSKPSRSNHEVLIQPTHEATILGAAVAVAIADAT